MRLSPKWGAEAGLRYDRMKYDKVVNPDTSESQTSPRFGLSYALDHRTNLRFSYGQDDSVRARRRPSSGSTPIRSGMTSTGSGTPICGPSGALSMTSAGSGRSMTTTRSR